MAALLAVLLTLAAVTPGAPDAVPPAPTRWVTDGAGFLSPAARAELDRRLEAYERATGRQVIVWIGRGIGGRPLEEWAARTFEAWGIGRKGKDDGAAIFLLADERRVRIEVGYGLEGLLPDVRAARIIRDQIVPRLRAGDRDGAVRAAVDGVLAALGGEAGLPPEPERAARPQLGLVHLVLMGLLLLFLLGGAARHPGLAAWMLWTLGTGGRRHGWGGGGWGGGGGGGGFSGGGGRSGGGGASGSW